MKLKKRYKIFDYPWHIPHLFDLAYALRNDCDFFLCLNTKKQWDETQRAIPQNVTFVTHYEEGLYDIAILHIDQSIIMSDSIKNLVYKQFEKNIKKIPKIILNHGTPVFPEGFHYMGYTKYSQKEMEVRCIEIIKELVGKNTMVVNSYEAAGENEWGFGIPIVHGMNPDDWSNTLNKEPRVFTALSPAGLDTYYNRKCMFDVHDLLLEKYGYHMGYAKLNLATDRSIDDYKLYLGESLIYIDTSFRTPMNRARTEAFLSGCCVIQVEGAHDLDRWAKHNDNIILVPNDPLIISETVVDILENRYSEALTIGQKGKQMAIENFSPERYRKDWLELLDKIVNE